MNSASRETVIPPVSERECRDYLGADTLSLSIGTIEVFKGWVDLGKPMDVDTDDVPGRLPQANANCGSRCWPGRGRFGPCFFIGQ